MQIKKEDIVIRFASRKEVNFFTKAGDINLCFIKQAYSKIASSPTKLGEIFAMGIPVVCNDGVGDVREIVESVDAGAILSNFNTEEFKRVIAGFDTLLKKDPATIRSRALGYYSLDKALGTYASIYKKLIG
ncbi:MAG: hypothetical protein NVV59_19880 [Chitinophagaceae bacterium]|nr:hypothetical protein [Chitinophagaceae bacterium]